jgi:hypothetical protein
MHDDPHPRNENCFPPEDIVNASELREFLFCERAWFLSRKGFLVSANAELQRAAGIEFHQERAVAANRGRSPWPFRWALILACAGIALLLLEVWMAGR